MYYTRETLETQGGGTLTEADLTQLKAKLEQLSPAELAMFKLYCELLLKERDASDSPVSRRSRTARTANESKLS